MKANAADYGEKSFIREISLGGVRWAACGLQVKKNRYWLEIHQPV